MGARVSFIDREVEAAQSGLLVGAAAPVSDFDDTVDTYLFALRYHARQTIYLYTHGLRAATDRAAVLFLSSYPQPAKKHQISWSLIRFGAMSLALRGRSQMACSATT